MEVESIGERRGATEERNEGGAMEVGNERGAIDVENEGNIERCR